VRVRVVVVVGEFVVDMFVATVLALNVVDDPEG